MAEPHVQMKVLLHPRAYDKLSVMAGERGFKPSHYVQLLFDAAYAARIGQERNQPASDAELDEQVRLVMLLSGQTDTATMARATGVPEARCAQILDALRQRKRGKAGAA